MRNSTWKNLGGEHEPLKKMATPVKYSLLKNIQPCKIFTPGNIHPWKIFTPEKYSPLKNIHPWKIFTPEKYSPLKNIHPWEVKWLNTQTLNARMIYPCHLLLYPRQHVIICHHSSSFGLPPLPLGWWRHLWTAPYLQHILLKGMSVWSFNWQ